MKKVILKVFLIIAILVGVLIVWELFFTNSGIMHTVYNAMAGGINSVFENFAGDGATLLPIWDGGNDGTYDSTNDGSTESGFEVDNDTK